MKFIVLLFAVLLQRQTKQTGYQRNHSWFKRIVTPFAVPKMTMFGQALVYSLLVLLPCLILGVGVASFSGMVGGTISLVLQVALFLYIIGRDDFSTRFENYQTCWQREDYQGAFHCAKQFLKVEQQTAESPLELHKAVLQAVVLAWFSRFFIFTFWFLIAGIGGAMACLLTYWFAREFKLDWLKNLLSALEWVPCRLLTVSIALAGDFVKSFPHALKSLTDFQSNTQQTLAATMQLNDGLDADNFDCSKAQISLEESNQLMQRCAVLWLLVVACLTVFTGF